MKSLSSTRLLPSLSTKHRLCFAFSLILGINSLLHAEAGNEADVKVAFLYNFFKFIEWPKAAASQAAYSLCTEKNDSLGEGLLVLEQKTVGINVMHIYRDVSDKKLPECHMVYIGSSENIKLILDRLKGLPVVTVSDQVDFIEQGGMIGLIQDGNRLNFEINLDRINAEGVHIDVKLLKLAKNVISTK
jgi:hypothetical protein